MQEVSKKAKTPFGSCHLQKLLPLPGWCVREKEHGKNTESYSVWIYAGIHYDYMMTSISLWLRRSKGGWVTAALGKFKLLKTHRF